MDITFIQIILSALFGGAFIGFVEFMIKRHDEKNDKNKAVLEAVDKLDKKVDERFDILDKKIDAVDRKGDERNAVSSRVRILRFSDEMAEGRIHSKDSWDQAMIDCDTYEAFCNDPKNKDFKNNITAATISVLKSGYKERLEKHDFL